MRHTGLVNRIRRVEATRSHVDVTRLAQRIAEVDGLSATELLAEAERIADACQRQGISSTGTTSFATRISTRSSAPTVPARISSP